MVYKLVVFPAIRFRSPPVFRVATDIHLHAPYAVDVTTPRDAATRIHDCGSIDEPLHYLHDGVPKPFPRMVVFIIKFPDFPGIGLPVDNAAMMFREVKFPYHPLHLSYRPFRVFIVHRIEGANLPALLGLVATLGVLYRGPQIVCIVDLFKKESNLFLSYSLIVLCKNAKRPAYTFRPGRSKLLPALH